MTVKNLKFLRLIIIIIAVGLLVFLIFNSRGMIRTTGGFIREIRVASYAKLNFISSFISRLGSIRSLAEENLRLQEENHQLLARLADSAEIKEQNDIFKEALSLKMLEKHKIVYAGIFNMDFSPDGHELLINKGRNENIEKDDIVISSSGILIGLVDEVFDEHSRIYTVTNPDFRATINVLLKDISGIAKGAMKEGIYLDFISQNDEVAEGDIISTGGNDLFPHGLIIGRVIEVSPDNGSLFKNVRVEPIMNELELNRVLIITD